MFRLEISNFQFPMETLGLFTEHEHKKKILHTNKQQYEYKYKH